MVESGFYSGSGIKFLLHSTAHGRSDFDFSRRTGRQECSAEWTSWTEAIHSPEVKQTHGHPDGEAYRAKTPPPGHRNRLLAALLVGGGPAPISTSTMGQLTNQEECLRKNPFIGLPRFFFVIGRLCILNKVPYPTVFRIRDPVPFWSWIWDPE